MNRLPTEYRHGGASASGHTLLVGGLNNGETSVFRTSENALQQKKNQVTADKNSGKKRPTIETKISM